MFGKVIFVNRETGELSSTPPVRTPFISKSLEHDLSPPEHSYNYMHLGCPKCASLWGDQEHCPDCNHHSKTK